MDDPAQETIAFELQVGTEFWDKPGDITVFIDSDLYWQGKVYGHYDRPDIIKFEATLACGMPHRLIIERQGKTPDQCVVTPDSINKDQMIRLLRVVIDGINIQNKVWHQSWFEPQYSQDWIEENLAQGIVLEKQVIGETWWGHNGRWYLEFASPFYRFLINDFR